LEEAQAVHSTAIALREELVHREGRRELREDLAKGFAVYASLLLQMGRRNEAYQRAREAVSILETLVAHSGRANLRRALDYAEEVAQATREADETAKQEKMAAAKAFAPDESTTS
jgi:hypothetical protein